MKIIKIKIFLVLLMLIPLPFSCLDESTCLDLYVPPYWRMTGLEFGGINRYHLQQNGMPLFGAISQDYADFVYPVDSMAIGIVVPEPFLQFHAQNTTRKGFSLTQDVLACTPDRPGFKGTLDLIERLHVTSNFDFDETHSAEMDLTDIIDVFVYTQDETSGGLRPLREYNNTMPHVAPNRVFLLFTRNARISPQQQFVITIHLKEREGFPARHFTVETPIINVKIR